MSGKGLEEITDSLPNRKNWKTFREKVTSKRKAQKSFSIPRKLRTSATKALILPLQQEVTNNMDALSRASTNSLPVDSDSSADTTLIIDTDLCTDESEWESYASIEEMRCSKFVSVDEVTIPPPMQFKDNDSEFFPPHDVGPIASTPFSPSEEQIFHFTEAASIPDISPIKVCDNENDTLKDLNFHSKSISTKQSKLLPVIPEDVIEENVEKILESIRCVEVSCMSIKNVSAIDREASSIPDISPIKVCDNENDTLKDMNFHQKSISTKQSKLLPVIPEDVIEESVENILDFITNTKSATSNGFEISRDSDKDMDQNYDENVKQNSDDEYVEKNFDEEYVEQNFDDEHVERNFDEEYVEQNLDQEDGAKHDKIGKSLRDMASNKGRDNFEDNRNTQIDTPKGKGKLYRDVKRKSNNSTGRFLKRIKSGVNLFENRSKYDNEDGFENAQNTPNEQLQLDELDNNPPETASHKRENKINKLSSVTKETQQDVANNPKRSQGRRKQKEKNVFENMSKNDNEDGFENAQNISNEELQLDELDNNLPETSAHKREKKNYKLFRVARKKQENVASIQNGSQGRRKRKGKNVFENMRKHDNEDGYENAQNTPNEELQLDELDNNPQETSAHKREKKITKYFNVTKKKQQDVDSITNRSQGRRERKEKVHKSVEDIYNFSNADSSEESQNIQIDALNTKQKRYRGLGSKYSTLGSRSKEAANSFNRSKNSAGRKDFEHVHDNQNEAKKLQWPICCIKNVEIRPIPILKTVMRYDLPIDSISLLCMGIDKKNCKH